MARRSAATDAPLSMLDFLSKTFLIKFPLLADPLYSDQSISTRWFCEYFTVAIILRLGDIFQGPDLVETGALGGFTTHDYFCF